MSAVRQSMGQHQVLRQDLRINPRLYQAMDLLYMPLLDLQQLTLRLRRDCPWDREQTAQTIVPHTVEEAYEVADAALGGDDEKLLSKNIGLALNPLLDVEAFEKPHFGEGLRSELPEVLRSYVDLVHISFCGRASKDAQRLT